MSTGRLRVNGAVRKCCPLHGILPAWLGSDQGRSQSWSKDRWRNPSSNSEPVPELEHVGRIDAEFATFSAFVDIATKCLATALASPPRPASDQPRALCALAIVSNVAKVFEETMNSVSAGSRSKVHRAIDDGHVQVDQMSFP
jgi:hypothetical protein